MKKSARTIGQGIAGLLVLLGAAACSTSNAGAIGTDTAAVEGAKKVAKTHVVSIRCEAGVVPECVETGWINHVCGEGHDELYTAYIVEPSASGTPSWREVIHHECEQAAVCPQTPIAVPLRHTVRTEPLCPGERAAKTKIWTIADDDGCQIACAGGDTLCCTALATGVAPEFKWEDVTTINAHVECTAAGCEGTFTGSNKGEGGNQLSAVHCTFETATEDAPERTCAD